MGQFYHFQLGDFECIALTDNRRVSSIGEEIIDVPPAELSAAMQALGYPADKVEIGYTHLLVNTGEQRVLIVPPELVGDTPA